MEPTIHDIGRPMIRSSRPIPPQEEERKKMREREDAKEAKERGEELPTLKGRE